MPSKCLKSRAKLARPLGSQGPSRPLKAARNRAGVVLHLVFIGLIGAATVTLFAVAFMAFLTAAHEPITASRVDERVLPSSDPSDQVRPRHLASDEKAPARNEPELGA